MLSRVSKLPLASKSVVVEGTNVGIDARPYKHPEAIHAK
jgi:hypothetical protein